MALIVPFSSIFVYAFSSSERDASGSPSFQSLVNHSFNLKREGRIYLHDKGNYQFYQQVFGAVLSFLINTYHTGSLISIYITADFYL